MRGKIKFYNEKKDFGFISTKKLKDDLYFKEENYPQDLTPHKSHKVEFKVVETSRGKEARDIHVLRI